jgi:hypothetical protein
MFKYSIDVNTEYLKLLYFIPNTNQELQITVNEWYNNRVRTLLKYGNISFWITVNITDLNNLFHNKQLFNKCLNNWDTSSVTNMGGMFDSVKAFNQCLNNWDTSSVVYMNGMFYNSNLTLLPNWYKK